VIHDELLPDFTLPLPRIISAVELSDNGIEGRSQGWHRCCASPRSERGVAASADERRVGMTDQSSTRDRVEGGVDQAKGNVKQGVGNLTGDNRMKGEGKIDEAKGKLKDLGADIKDAAADAKDRI
jgi:uncharacterized protein YjbJ (UPF0337 family)